MAPRQPTYPPAPRPNQGPKLIWARRPNPQAFRPPIDIRHEHWLQRTLDRFHQLILLGESEPSNGTVRKVDPPDGETCFAVAYGDAPDHNLRALLESIYSLHGDVHLLHDGRDSTGKHWIKCFTKGPPGPFQQLTEKATICVSSKLELATIPRSLPPGKGKGKASRNGQERPPKVPGAVKGAPDDLVFLPWSKQLPWLEPAAAQALRNKVDAEELEYEYRKKLLRERQRVRRG
ncbi:MAG: hypothetical protein Q9161_004173 [Pseudevernia consocians]